jgi:acyl-CoA thioester hydrolase
VDGFAFTHLVRVRFAETDAQGIAHHASFVVWLEEARVAYLAAFAGGYRAIRERGIEALTTAVHVEYGRAAAFDDVLEIGVRCGELRGARFRFDYEVERDGIRVAWGWTSHATVDAATHRPTRVPAWFAADVLSAERRTSPSASASPSGSRETPAPVPSES